MGGANGRPKQLRRTTRSGVGKIRERPDMVDSAFRALTARLKLSEDDQITEIMCYGMGETISIIHAKLTPRFGNVLVVTHPKRYPTWDEIAEARYQLCPDDAYMVVPLPPSDRLVSLHPNSFIMVEVRVQQQQKSSGLVDLTGKPLA